MLSQEQFETLEDRAALMADEKVDKGMVDWVTFPELPEGALWPTHFETTGEAHVTQWVKKCGCCGPEQDAQTVPARFVVEQDGPVVAVKVSFTFDRVEGIDATPEDVEVEFVHEFE